MEHLPLILKIAGFILAVWGIGIAYDRSSGAYTWNASARVLITIGILTIGGGWVVGSTASGDSEPSGSDQPSTTLEEEVAPEESTEAEESNGTESCLYGVRRRMEETNKIFQTAAYLGDGWFAVIAFDIEHDVQFTARVHTDKSCEVDDVEIQ